MATPEPPKSALGYILTALIPYSRANLQLAYHPNQFFNELERISNRKRSTLQTAMWRAQQKGLIEREGRLIKLTDKGLEAAQPYTAKKLPGDAKLMIVFDVPERLAPARRRLRQLLREWNFKQVQKSVWVSESDYQKALIKAIKELEIDKHIVLYESARVYPK